MQSVTKQKWFNSFVCFICLCAGVITAAAQTSQAQRPPEKLIERPTLGQRLPLTYSASGRVTGTLVSGGSEAIKGWYGVKISFSRTDGSGAAPSPVFTHTDGTWSASGFERGVSYRATASYP